MPRRAWLVATWIAVTGLVSWVTFQALASAEEGVGADTLPAVVVEGTRPEETSTSLGATSQVSPTTTPQPSTTVDPEGGRGTPTSSGAPATTASTSVSTTSQPATTAPTGPASPSTAPSPSTSPTTTQPPASWETHVVSSGGGTVTVRYRPGEVEYQAAVPAPGFAVEVDRRSPEVRVEFVGDDVEWDVRVRWDDGRLDVDVRD